MSISNIIELVSGTTSSILRRIEFQMDFLKPNSGVIPALLLDFLTWGTRNIRNYIDYYSDKSITFIRSEAFTSRTAFIHRKLATCQTCLYSVKDYMYGQLVDKASAIKTGMSNIITQEMIFNSLKNINNEVEHIKGNPLLFSIGSSILYYQTKDIYGSCQKLYQVFNAMNYQNSREKLNMMGFEFALLTASSFALYCNLSSVVTPMSNRDPKITIMSCVLYQVLRSIVKSQMHDKHIS